MEVGNKVQAKKAHSPERQSNPPVEKRENEPGPLKLPEMMPLGVAGLELQPPGSILAVQRAAGNRSVSRQLGPVIQAKLMVGPVNDTYEQEADRVADRVMGSDSASRRFGEARPAVLSINRQEDELQAQRLAAWRAPAFSIKPLQRQENEDELQFKPLQRQEDGSFEAGGEVERRLAASRSGGQPLPTETRTFMEPRFGADFSGVRVHTGGEAVQLNRDLRARAFTNGSDIYFGAGQYNPATTAGKTLLAHELTHTIQQTGGSLRPAAVQRLGKNKTPFGPKTETETKIEQLVADLSSELKGHTGFFRTKRKTEAAFESQQGRLSEEQSDKIKQLGELAPGELKKLGFLLPGEVAQLASEKPGFDEKDEKKKKAWEDKIDKLPVKQRMQVNTHAWDNTKIGDTRVVFLPKEEPKVVSDQTRPPVPPRPGQPLTRPRAGAISLPKEMFQRPQEAPTPSSSQVVLEPGKGGEEKTKHNVDAYLDVLAGYVRAAGTDQAVTLQAAEMLTIDLVDLEEGKQKFDRLDRQVPIAKMKLSMADRPGSGVNEKKTAQKELDDLNKARTGMLKALGKEKSDDFNQPTQDARQRNDFGQRGAAQVTQEKAIIEHLYDSVRAKHQAIEKTKSSASRAEKKSGPYMFKMAFQEASAADESKAMAQQAKMSMDVIKVRRQGIEQSRDHVKVTLNRFPGAIRNFLGTVAAGIGSAVLSILTLGIVGLDKRTDKRGYQKTWPWKATFLNDIVKQITQFKNVIKGRPTGPKAVDYVSAILRGFNEIVVQNVINIAGKFSLVTGLVGTVLTVGAAALTALSLGGASPLLAVAPIMATISSIAGYIAIAAALLKVAISAVRLTLDGLSLLLNSDAKVSNFLRSRMKQTTLETTSDVVQAVGSATAPLTGGAIKGDQPFNVLDPRQFVREGIADTMRGTGVEGAREAVSKGITIGALTAKTSVGTVAPVVAGPVTQGIVGAADTNYGLYTGPGGSRLTSKSSPNQPGTGKVDGSTPGWMQSEMAKQQQIQVDAYKGQTTKAIGELAPVENKTTDLGNKLNTGQEATDKLKSLVGKSKAGGNDEVDPETEQMAESQDDFLKETSGVTGGILEALTHGKTEIVKLSTSLD